MFQFNARQYDPYVGYEPVPAGKYPVVIRKSNMKRSKPPKQGGYLQLDYEIIDGPMRGKVIFDRLNLWNENAQTVDIANRQLSAICHVLNVYDVQGSEAADNAVAQLHNQPFVIDVVVQPADDRGNSASNNVKGYMTMQGQPPSRQGGGAPGAPGAPAGMPPGGQAPGGWGAPATPAPGPAAPSAGPGWGAPQGGAPAQPPQGGAPGGWGGAPAQPQGGAPAQPGPAGGPQWGAPQPQPQPQPPQGAPAQPSWGAPQGAPQGAPAWGAQPPAGGPAPGGQAPWGAPA